MSEREYFFRKSESVIIQPREKKPGMHNIQPARTTAVVLKTFGPNPPLLVLFLCCLKSHSINQTLLKCNKQRTIGNDTRLNHNDESAGSVATRHHCEHKSSSPTSFSNSARLEIILVLDAVS